MHPSAIFMTLSTSPLKSACPGVSMIFIFVPLNIIEVFLARIVMPFSLSRGLLSIINSPGSSRSLKVLFCFSKASTKVVLPWSTWAIMVIFLIFSAGSIDLCPLGNYLDINDLIYLIKLRANIA